MIIRTQCSVDWKSALIIINCKVVACANFYFCLFCLHPVVPGTEVTSFNTSELLVSFLKLNQPHKQIRPWIIDFEYLYSPSFVAVSFITQRHGDKRCLGRICDKLSKGKQEKVRLLISITQKTNKFNKQDTWKFPYLDNGYDFAMNMLPSDMTDLVTDKKIVGQTFCARALVSCIPALNQQLSSYQRSSCLGGLYSEVTGKMQQANQQRALTTPLSNSKQSETVTSNLAYSPTSTWNK